MRDYNKQKYLKLLSKEYKNITEVSEEIINLKAILNLPKGTEVFLFIVISHFYVLLIYDKNILPYYLVL